MCIYNMEEMCTGAYACLGSVFGMAEWDGTLCFPSEPRGCLVLLAWTQLRPWHLCVQVGLAGRIQGPCFLLVPWLTSLVSDLGQSSLPSGFGPGLLALIVLPGPAPLFPCQKVSLVLPVIAS